MEQRCKNCGLEISRSFVGRYICPLCNQTINALVAQTHEKRCRKGNTTFGVSEPLCNCKNPEPAKIPTHAKVSGFLSVN